MNPVISTLPQGFYHESGSVCKFADNEQITKELYILQHDLYYVAKNGTIYHIKKGFIHDGASKGFLKRFGRYTNAAILHDALYGSNKEPRDVADELFLEAMEFSEVQYIRRYAYYWTVRSLGYFAYNKKSSETKVDSQYINIYRGK